MQDHMTLFDVLRVVWRGRLHVIAGIFIGAVLAFGFVMSSVPGYRSQLIVAPANPISGTDMSSLVGDGNLFALSYLAQRVGVGHSTDFSRFETLYKGVSVAEILLNDPVIQTGLSRDRSFVFSEAEMSWFPAKLAEYIDQRVYFENVGLTSSKRMVYVHPDAEFGRYFLIQIHRVTDSIMRERLRTESTERVAYLKQSVRETNNPEHRRALTTLLLEQERLKMLVSIDQPYVASVVDPASSKVDPVWPNSAFVFVACMFVGGFLGFVVFGFRLSSAESAFDADSPEHSDLSYKHLKSRSPFKSWFRSNSKNSNRRALKARDDEAA